MSQHESFADWISAVVEDEGALEFLRIVFSTVELWDDLVDRDAGISEDAVHQVFTQLLIDLPQCSFYRAFQQQLSAALLVAITSWHTSNAMMGGSAAERAQAYTLRKEFINLVVLCVALVSGFEKAKAASLLGWRDSAADDPAEKYTGGV
jgi:hypothetical protein